MEVRQPLDHLREEIAQETAKQQGIELSGQWIPCIACFKAKARRNAVPKSKYARSASRTWRFFVKLGSSMPTVSLGGHEYVIIFVDNFQRFEIVRFIRKSDTPAGLRNIIAKYITPIGLKIGSIRTHEEG